MAMRSRTSISHPLQFGDIPAPGGGSLGLTFCPGKWQEGAATGAWDRDLNLDLRAVRSSGAKVLVTLVTPDEMVDLRVTGLGEAATAVGLNWLHLPIVDGSTPTARWLATWEKERGVVHHELDAGGRVVVHCKGGLGRAGTVAGLILVERGMRADHTLIAIGEARPGAPETQAQRAYVRNHSLSRQVTGEA